MLQEEECCKEVTSPVSAAIVEVDVGVMSKVRKVWELDESKVFQCVR